MLRFFAREVFKEIKPEGKLMYRYAISNYGRLVSFTDKPENGRFVKGSTQEGYKIFRYKIRNEDNSISHKHFFFFRMVAEQFLPKTSKKQQYVLHLDYIKTNDFVENLKWATRDEMLEHSSKSPYVIAAKKNRQLTKSSSKGLKLTTTQVMFLKKQMLDPNRKTRVKLLAKKFGVSEMTLYRIKSGENWGYIQV